ncbi:MAG: hypothetical protein NXH85_13540 [Pseudomonadaceae bacterium]|nr:hypothetical protein [Pseudomonadaceae bacterium]
MTIRTNLAIFTIALNALFSVNSAHASDTFGCEVALVETNINYQFDSTLRMSMLHLIDRQSFNERRKSGGGGFTIPIKGVPVSAFADYDTFDQARQKEFEKHSFNLSKENAQTYLATYVPEGGFKAFTDCLRIKAQSTNGLHLIQKEVTPTYVSVDAYWNPPAGIGERDVTAFNVEGGRLVDTFLPPSEVEPNYYYALDFKRVADEPFRFTIQAEGYLPKRISIPVLGGSDDESLPPWLIPGYRPSLSVLVHQQTYSDLQGKDGIWIGIKGQSKRLEGFSVSFEEEIPGLGLEYMCHLQSSGDSLWVKAGTFCGTRGQKRRLEGFAMRLTGQLAPSYQIVYGCHLQGVGDVAGVVGSNYCGTRGLKKRVESMTVYVERIK